MAATVPVDDKGAGNPLLDEAMKIGETPDPEDQTGQPGTRVIDPKPGSFESFLGSFGNPRRWAGH